MSDGTPTPPVTASVTVSATVTNVDYSVPSVTNPGTGVGGKAITGYGFTITNNGSAGGSRPVKWWAYLSDSANLNAAGMLLLDSDIVGAAPLGSLATSGTIAINGTWPLVPVPAGATKYLVVQISADDDLNSTNNLAGTPSSSIASLPVVISPPQVDYVVSTIANNGPIVAGGPLAGKFTFKNAKSDTGINPNVQWTAYVSIDSSSAIVLGDKAIDSGTVAAPTPPGTSSATINFAGTWPTAPSPPSYFLKVAVYSPDDVDHTNDALASGAITTTHVDYQPSAVVSNGALLAPGPVNGLFVITNIGNATGAQPVNWVVWASANNVLDAGDTPVASGTYPAGLLPLGAPVINFSGTWPTPVGTEYLFVTVTAADDTDSTNNEAMSPQYTTTVPNVDYTVTSVVSAGPLASGGPLTGKFVFQNGRSDNGTQTVYWTAYVSTDGFPAIVPGTDKIIDSGTTTGLVHNTSSANINFGGTWPTPGPGPYFLKVAVSASDDIDSTNNVGASLANVTTFVN